MNTKFNTAAIKVLEAAKLIQTVKKPDFTERHEDLLRMLWQIGAELLEQKPKVTDKK